MYFANENTYTQFNSYQRLLNSIIEDDSNNRFKSLLDEIITTTHRLIIKEIEQDNVSHKYYDLVLALSDYEKSYTRDFFKNIDPNNIGESDYVTVRNMLNSIIHNPEF